MACGTLCRPDLEENAAYSFVGDGRGAYEPADKYDYVGEGTGQFDKVVQTTYYGFRLKKVWLALLVAGIFLFITGWGIVTFMPGDSGSEANAARAVSRPAAAAAPAPQDVLYDCNEDLADYQAVWPSEKKGWCCLHMGLGCEVATPATVTYDCKLNEATHNTAWSLEKKKWCCHEKNLHCDSVPAPGAGAVQPPLVSRPAPLMAKLPPQAGQVQPIGGAPLGSGAAGCEALCVYKSRGATCRSRIQWSMQHSFKDKGEFACRLAHDKVLGQCTACSGCGLSGPGGMSCADPVTISEAGRPPTAVAATAARGPAPGQAHPGAVTDPPAAQAAHGAPGGEPKKAGLSLGLSGAPPVGQTSLPYDCHAGYAKRDEWPKGKRTWCCFQRGLACPEDK